MAPVASLPATSAQPDPNLSESDLSAAEALALRVRAKPGAFPDEAALAAAVGLSRPGLRRLVQECFHTTPEAWLREARVAAVCRGLLGGRRRVADLAAEAGWTDPASFAVDFLAVTCLSPESYRKIPRARGFLLELPPDHLSGPVLSFLGRDLEGRAERVSESGFAKALLLDGRPAVISVEFEPGGGRCRIESERLLSPAAAAGAHRAVLRLLGLFGPSADPAPFLRRLRRLGLSRLAQGREGLRPPLSAEPFEGLAWAIVGQQINVAFAATLRRRLIETCGSPAPGGLVAHPDAVAVAALDPGDLTPLQYSRRKAEYLIGAAREVTSGALPLEELALGPASLAERKLLAVRGLGPWSAQYILLRALGFGDCVPAGDAGLSAAAVPFFGLDHRPGPDEVRTLLAPLAPHRSLATCHLWASLGDPVPGDGV